MPLERERERGREGGREGAKDREIDRDRERERERERAEHSPHLSRSGMFISCLYHIYMIVRYGIFGKICIAYATIYIHVYI